jgi:hypothetical protein
MLSRRRYRGKRKRMSYRLTGQYDSHDPHSLYNRKIAFHVSHPLDTIAHERLQQTLSNRGRVNTNKVIKQKKQSVLHKRHASPGPGKAKNKYCAAFKHTFFFFMLMHIRVEAASPLPATPQPRPPSPLHPIRTTRTNIHYFLRLQPSQVHVHWSAILTPFMTFSILAR